MKDDTFHPLRSEYVQLAGCQSNQETSSDSKKEEAAKVDSDEDMTSQVKKDGDKYKIALSNSYMSNDWRQQMERIVEYTAEQEPYKSRCELTIVNCENSPEDQPASEESANHITIDAVKAYKVMAKWLAEAVGGKGNVVLDQGLPGAAVSEQEYNAAKEIFDSYPDMKVVSDFINNYAEADGEAALSSVIAANSDIDVVVTQGYMTSVTNAFKKAGIEDIPASCGGGYNGNLLTCLENDSQGIIHVYIPGISAIALNYAIRILDGEEIDKNISIDPAYVATSNEYDMGEFSDVRIEVAEDGVNCFSDQPDNLQWPVVPSNFGVEIPMDVVLGK